MTLEERQGYFEYFLSLLYDEKRKVDGNPEENDFSVLKVMKLLFFVSAIKSNQKPYSDLVESVFKFNAMPYGHVESNIYSIIRNKEGILNYFKIDNRKTTLIESQFNFGILDPSILGYIRDSFEELMNTNPKLISFKAFELVDLSHLWYSWRKTYEEAQNLITPSYSRPIDADLIKKEDKIFNLY